MKNITFPIHNPSVTQSDKLPTLKQLDRYDQLLVVVSKSLRAAAWKKLPQGAKLHALLGRRSPDSQPVITSRLANQQQTAVAVARVQNNIDSFEAANLARSAIASIKTERPRSLAIIIMGFDPDKERRWAELLCTALHCDAFELQRFSKKTARQRRLGRIRYFGLSKTVDFGRARAEASGNNLARWLAALPPNVLDALVYRDIARRMASDNGWQFREYTIKDLKKLGAGAFLAVAQGNARDDAAIVHLRYQPAGKKSKRQIALVGKGIIFDTGGTNLKPFASMLDMHTDMQGSAVALGTLLALTELQAPFAIDCWLAISENRSDATAYKSQDVITALNGKTIQTIHTDAEGRMVLADTLSLAARAKPDLMVDFATLTGTCISAITTRYSGVFTNRAKLHPLLKRNGLESGERVWPFPIGEEFVDMLKSDTADMQQCSPDSAGDHILAASFLSEFVPAATAWVHMDISASSNKGGLGMIGTDITGFGVRYTLQLLLDNEDAVFAAI